MARAERDETIEADLHRSQGEATDAMRHAARAGRAAIDRSRQELEDAFEAAQEGLQEAERYLRQTAAQRPLATMAVAAGAGLLIGMLLGGQRR